MGIRAFDVKLRAPIYAIYGFVRFADEIVDTFHDFVRKAYETINCVDRRTQFYVKSTDTHRKRSRVSLRNMFAAFLANVSV